YFDKVVKNIDKRTALIVDPMLATGGSAVQCIEQLIQRGAKKLTMICIIAAPEGIECLEAAYPDVEIVAGKIDRELNDQKFILPGLGDFGDRLFNT
ncbi:MAG: uracil phosphoribosyltransferase, partial [Opitutales bacterium]